MTLPRPFFERKVFMLTLKPISLTDERAFYDMLQHIGFDENGFQNKVKDMPYENFPAWLARQVNMAQGIGLKDWMVPSTTFWLMDGDTPLGQGMIRHRLTDALRESGGHIGYAVAAPYRGKGYGKELLRLLITEARAMGITEPLLVTVRPDNTPSRRAAEANGGLLVREAAEHIYYEFSM